MVTVVESAQSIRVAGGRNDANDTNGATAMAGALLDGTDASELESATIIQVAIPRNAAGT